MSARLEFLREGAVARITIAAPKPNILDRRMIAAIHAHVGTLLPRRDLCAILFAAEGPHFSFGASVVEHLPDTVATLLDELHALLWRMINLPAPTICAIQGQCLGGGFELALACDLLVAEESAQLACPEIRLGVFPPAAAALLPARIGASRAAALMLTGRPTGAREACAAGLVARVARDGQLASSVEEWLTDDFLPRSPAALRCAAIASRTAVRRALEEDLAPAERLYLDDLMRQPDAVEGLRAFLEKRPPRWTERARHGEVIL